MTEATKTAKRFAPKKTAAAPAAAATEEAPAKQKTPKAEKPKAEKAPKAEKPLVSVEDQLKALKKSNPEMWGKVERVTEASDKNRPLRVLIKCTDPQTDREGNKLCGGTREIAVQDLFQVHRCQPCQKRYLQVYRNKAAKDRRPAKAAKA